MSGMSGRWTSALRKKATDAAANAVVQAVVWFGGSIVLPYLGSKYGPDWPGRFLTASVRLPSWVLVSCALFAIGVTWKGWATFGTPLCQHA